MRRYRFILTDESGHRSIVAGDDIESLRIKASEWRDHLNRNGKRIVSMRAETSKSNNWQPCAA